MRRILMATSVVLVVVVVGSFAAGAVFAQDPTATPVPAQPQGRPWGGMWHEESTMSKALTDLLGMTPGQLLDARMAGKTVLDIAKEKGVTEQQLADALVAGRKEALDQAVKDGKLTQEQADWMLNRMKALVPFDLTNPFKSDKSFGPMGPMGPMEPMGRGGDMRGGKFGRMHEGMPGGMGPGMRDRRGDSNDWRGGRGGGPGGQWGGGPGGDWGGGPWGKSAPAPTLTPAPGSTTSS
jgi:hypothetical protein